MKMQSMTTFLLTTHPGALEWMLAQSFPGVNWWMPPQDFDPNLVQAGDRVIGTLPTHLADAVRERGGHCSDLKPIPSNIKGGKQYEVQSR